MKQTDKCECGHDRISHLQKYRQRNNGKSKDGMCDYVLINKCKCQNFKSHSQSLPEQLERPVRASEEVVIKDMINNVKVTPSSVPYTPLDKNKVFMTPFNNVGFYMDEYVLSALNGLREDILTDKNEKQRTEWILWLIEKWFPILKDSEDEKK